MSCALRCISVQARRGGSALTKCATNKTYNKKNRPEKVQSNKTVRKKNHKVNSSEKIIEKSMKRGRLNLSLLSVAAHT